MLRTIKNYLLAGLAVVTGILAALWQYQKAKFAKASLRGSEKARETEQKATDAIIKGMEKENEIKNDDTTDRKSFLD